MVAHGSIYLPLYLLVFFILVRSYSASNTNITQLVDEVCKKTSNYSFCVESLYSDPHTPDADRYSLAYVSFCLAYLNATNTRDYITKLLKHANSSHHHYQQDLQRCAGDYKKAVSAIEMAYNDLNSETFFELADLAGVAAHSAENCQANFKGTHSSLTSRNKALKGLCEICVVVSKLFT
ncbi:Pectinesterase inhibitor [Quillaja saponaria]|uniref:Pectinesterase inhibitor n=1 Tax=Quillaja saponaria TaxID=32244 RepID=A0AAD7M0V0_QUISA|nr:Pectinesterase inhibitor [Quillaja saponaria]